MACLDDASVGLYVRRQLPPQSLAELDAHLLDCNICRAKVEAASRATDTDTVTVAVAPPASALDAGAKLERGTIVGRFVVVDSVGEGGMGVVYAAYDPELNRRVALKFLQGGKSDTAQQRLLR